MLSVTTITPYQVGLTGKECLIICCQFIQRHFTFANLRYSSINRTMAVYIDGALLEVMSIFIGILFKTVKIILDTLSDYYILSRKNILDVILSYIK